MRAVLAIFCLLSLAPAAAAAPNVEIRRTSHGIPHIKASNFNGAAFGYGYAFAQDNLCEMAETYVTVNGERSRYFGPDGSYESRGNGAMFNNLDSDFRIRVTAKTSRKAHDQARPSRAAGGL